VDRVTALKRAAALIDARDLAGAEAALEPLLRDTPGDALALNLMGIVRMRQGQNVLAVCPVEADIQVIQHRRRDREIVAQTQVMSEEVL